MAFSRFDLRTQQFTLASKMDGAGKPACVADVIVLYPRPIAGSGDHRFRLCD